MSIIFDDVTKIFTDKVTVFKSMVDHKIKKQSLIAKGIATTSNFSFLNMSAKRVEGSDYTSKSTSNLHSVFIQEYSLNSEFNLLKNHLESGIYVIPAAKTPFIWFGVIFVRSGIYEGGIFRFRLFIPHTFPECSVCPKLTFETPVFHPYVHPSTDELYIRNNSSFIEWRKNVNHLWQVICYMKTIFYNISTSGAVNQRAAHLYETDTEEFLKLVKECVENSKIRIYDKKANEDPHYMLFDQYDSEIHDTYTEMLLKEKMHSQSNECRSSITWVQSGSLEPLSKYN